MLQQSKPAVELYKEAPSIIDQMVEDAMAPKPVETKLFQTTVTIKEFEYEWQRVYAQMKAAEAYAVSIQEERRARRCGCACGPCVQGDCSNHLNPKIDSGIPHVPVSAKRIDNDLGL